MVSFGRDLKVPLKGWHSTARHAQLQFPVFQVAPSPHGVCPGTLPGMEVPQSPMTSPALTPGKLQLPACPARTHAFPAGRWSRCDLRGATQQIWRRPRARGREGRAGHGEWRALRGRGPPAQGRLPGLGGSWNGFIRGVWDLLPWIY